MGTPESVYLWLGANVMLEYPLDEAKELLETNVKDVRAGGGEREGFGVSTKDEVTVMARCEPRRERERERESAWSRALDARERTTPRPTD